MNQRPLRPLEWVGDSKERLKEFPQAVQKEMGDALFMAQAGRPPPSAKPLKGIDSGVFEIVSDYRSDTYRAVYAVKIGESIYMLHAFQKKSKRGIKTPKQEINLIKRRFKIAQQLEAEHERRHQK